MLLACVTSGLCRKLYINYGPMGIRGQLLTPFCLAMMKIAPSCLLLFAVTLTVKCNLRKEDFKSTAANPPASGAVCGQREKLDLNAVGVELKFEVQNALDVESSFEYATDGNKATDWGKCTVSSLANKIDYWIDLRNVYPIDRITLLSRGSYSKGAMVFVGNFSAARTAENQQRCGGSYPERASLTEFDCDGTYWVQYVRIRLVSAALTSLQICEIEVYHNGKHLSFISIYHACLFRF